jgi:hypothetical protein
VSVGWSTEKGLDYLKKFGSFDELSVGHNWLNTLSVAFIWRDLPASAVIPQVLVIERPIKVSESNLSVGPDRLVARAIGVASIEGWINQGMRQ